MLKSADLHETILTPVICHKHIRCHDGVTLYFSMKFPLVVPKKARNGHFSIYVSTFPLSEVKTKKKGNFDWTLVNTENLRAEIATCQRQYYTLNQVATIAICTTCAKIISKWRFLATQYPCSTANGTGISSRSISKSLAFFRESFTCSNVILALRFISLDNKML